MEASAETSGEPSTGEAEQPKEEAVSVNFQIVQFEAHSFTEGREEVREERRQADRCEGWTQTIFARWRVVQI